MIDDDLYAAAEATLASLRARGLTCATAESCTGGLIAAALTAVPGSSDVFLGGFVTYSNAMKRDILSVSQADLDAYGAVSEQVARAMAEGARARSGADVAVSVTGVAGPGGGTAEKPVGLVWFGVSGADAQRQQFGASHSRSSIRSGSTAFALTTLRRVIAKAES